MCTRASRDPDSSMAVSVDPLSARPGSDSAIERTDAVAADTASDRTLSRSAGTTFGASADPVTWPPEPPEPRPARRRLEVAERVNGRRACPVAARSVPVGNGDQARAGVAGVLVPRAHPPEVGGGGVADGERGSGRPWSGGRRRQRLGHGRRSRREIGDEELSKPLTFGEFCLCHPQEGRDRLGGLSRRGLHHGADLGERHAEAAQPADEAGPFQLGRRVVRGNRTTRRPGTAAAGRVRRTAAAPSATSRDRRANSPIVRSFTATSLSVSPGARSSYCR